MLVVAFFAVPAMAQCSSGPADFLSADMSFGSWPTNMNLDSVSSGTQNAFGFWGGDASNALAVEKDQQAGILYQEEFPVVACGCNGTDLRQWDSRVINIERISSGNQFATATGASTATNSITVKSTQCTDKCEC
jgi:hypothetical protein